MIDGVRIIGSPNPRRLFPHFPRKLLTQITLSSLLQKVQGVPKSRFFSNQSSVKTIIFETITNEDAKESKTLLLELSKAFKPIYTYPKRTSNFQHITIPISKVKTFFNHTRKTQTLTNQNHKNHQKPNKTYWHARATKPSNNWILSSHQTYLASKSNTTLLKSLETHTNNN